LPFLGPGGEQEELACVLGAVQAGFHHPDELCEKLGFEARRIQQLLLTLTLRGALVPDPNGCYRALSI
jgi:predicted Rossmann fold nucleotide-binding protein DprA/Smf involved in DNA uptake